MATVLGVYLLKCFFTCVFFLAGPHSYCKFAAVNTTVPFFALKKV